MPKKRNNIGLDFLPDNLKQKIERKLKMYNSIGLSVQDKPTDTDLNFPEKISSLSLAKVRDLHAKFEAYLGYVQDKIKFYKVVELEVIAEYERQYNKILSTQTARNNIEIKKAKARTEIDELTQELKTTISQIINLLEADKEKFENNVMTLRAELKVRELNSNY